MPFSDFVPVQAPITTDLAALTPLGDFVLVEEIRGVKSDRASSLIVDPGEMNVTGDGRLIHNRAKGLRIGRVVACGDGDKRVVRRCNCGAKLPLHPKTSGTEQWLCTKCGLLTVQNWDYREPMHVQPGDIVLYPRVPANDVIINEKPYTMLHEEQHVLAVLDEAE